ncbi:MAG: sugar ABC transporter permease [Tessaracoccus sp.]|uniref:carbohydrate ABC transporter permease n=1 Tax=Tessaracoccus sp. TaxID=1971211 RepID=UPI001EBE24B5|nr:sugar ABC transporter permease [Tessaracoccus sp.]MBK7819685.1 sugar ABC transporter permease [Tessaracoccus sp.]
MSTAAKAATGTGGTTARPHKRRQFNWRTALTIFAYLSPAFLFVIIFTYYPLFVGGRMAFHQWTLWDLTNTPFVGLGNFATLIADPLFPKVMLNSVIWVVGSLVPQFVFGFLIALALKKRFRFRGLYQALVFYPWAVSGFLIGILFRWMFNSEFGVFNDMLMRSGITQSPIPWLANPDLALVSVILANVWYGVAFFAMMILAALQSVPDELHEAAALDGAGRLGTLFRVTIPTIRTTLVLTVLLRVIWIFNFPDIIYAMTGGGPANQTQIATTWMIQFTQQGDYGLASALGFIVMGVLVTFTAVYLTLLSKERAL